MLSDKWVTYQEWNEAVAAVIYPFVDDSRPVYMDLPDKTLQKIADEAGHAGDPKAGLVAAVRACVATGSEFWLRPLVRRQMQWFEEEPDEVPPPCLAYLAVTVLAAEEMGSAGSGLAHNAYYPRLARSVQYVGGVPMEVRQPLARKARGCPRIADRLRAVLPLCRLADFSSPGSRSRPATIPTVLRAVRSCAWRRGLA